MPEYHALTFEYPKYPYLPYYTTDMPYEVMLGYIVMDSVCRLGNMSLINEFLNRQTFNDSIKKIINYIFRMSDWDPYLFKKTQYYDAELINGSYLLHPSFLIDKLIEKSASLSSNYKLFNLLLASHYILHVKITDTLSRTYQYSNIPIPVAIVNYEILDTIKGKKIPKCKDISINNDTKNNEYKDILLESQNCSQFEYGLFWQRTEHLQDIIMLNKESGNSLIDSNGVIWTKKEKEYIVCLRILLTCSTKKFDYIRIMSNVMPSLTCTMYPIEEGKVQDPGNEFGFGTNVDVDQFKLLLRQKINEILSY